MVTTTLGDGITLVTSTPGLVMRTPENNKTFGPNWTNFKIPREIFVGRQYFKINMIWLRNFNMYSITSSDHFRV